MIIKRLKSDNGLEFRHGMYGILLAIATVVSTYFMIANYKEINGYCISGYVLLLIAFFTTGTGIKDYKSNKNVHKGSFDHFINSINISHMSILGEMEKNADVAKLKSKEDSSFACTVFFLGIVPLCVGALYWVLSDAHNYYPFVVTALNFLLIVLDCRYSGYKLNTLKVEEDKLISLFQVNDLIDSEKNKLRNLLSRKIDKKGFVTRYTLYKICNEVREEQVKRKQKEALGFDFGQDGKVQNSFKEPKTIGELFGKIKSGGGTKEII